jgi:hypothetical protein
MNLLSHLVLRGGGLVVARSARGGDDGAARIGGGEEASWRELLGSSGKGREAEETT